MINFNAILVGYKGLENCNSSLPSFYWQPTKFHFLPRLYDLPRFDLRCVFLSCFHSLITVFVISPCQCQRRIKPKSISVTKKVEIHRGESVEEVDRSR